MLHFVTSIGSLFAVVFLLCGMLVGGHVYLAGTAKVHEKVCVHFFHTNDIPPNCMTCSCFLRSVYFMQACFRY
uniref:Putative secreted protein n=1 Tax=Amblyomma triste TaxID=251400 RepID=A0A023FZQ4_AMBTT